MLRHSSVFAAWHSSKIFCQIQTLIYALSLNDVQLNDAVFIKWKSGYLLHLVKEIQGEKILIGNNIGKTNGWIHQSDIIGKVTEIQD